MDPINSPESLLSASELFGAVVRFRATMLDQISVDAAFAVDSMEAEHPQRELNNKRWLMSKVAQDMDVLAAGAVTSDHDPSYGRMEYVDRLLSEQPTHTPDEQERIKGIYEKAKVLKPEVPEEAEILQRLRSNVDEIHGKRQGLAGTSEYSSVSDEQFGLAA